MIGRVVGQFRIVELLGQGGMGVVYRARDERLRRDVALKFLPPEVLSSDSSRRRFHHEALALSRLNHPGVATVHDFQSADGLDFLVMEYIAGQSLDQLIASGPMAETAVVTLGIQLAEGLAEAHRHGVIHRDLKPGNLRLTPEGRLKILDFGLAKWLAPVSESMARITESDPHSLAGSPAYIAPELLRGAPAGERSDLYAAGLVLYQAATGSLPFPGLPVGVLLEAILNREPPPARTRNLTISPALESVIHRCIEKDPERRYASATELADELRRVQAGAPVRGARAPRRRLLPALTLVAIGAAVLAGFAFWRRSHPAAKPEASSIRSLAVLPLGNLSGLPEQEYLADGMTEELISQLSHVRAIRVISLTSVMRYKNSSAPMPQIARELGADGVIEGNVLRSGGHLRATVHLVAAHEDNELWSGKYDGDTTHLLSLQSRIARSIVREIQVRLTPEERARLSGRRRVDPAAYQLYLRGRYQWNRRSDAGIRRAIEYFQSAIEQDSSDALLYGGLADAWAAEGLYGMIPPLQAGERARAAAARAVALDPDLSEARTSQAHLLHNFDWDWYAAEQEYQHAIELNPNNAVAHHWLGDLMAQQGRFDEARQELREAEALDPLSITIAIAGGVVEYYAGRYDLALEHYRKASELDSTNSLLHRAAAGALDRMGREHEAALELARSFELRGQPEVGAALVRAHAAGGIGAVLELLIGGLLRKRASGAYEPAEHVAELYARLGQKNRAFEWLEVALREHDTELNRLRVDPIFGPLRSDRRFDDLLRRVGFLPPGGASAPPAAGRGD